MSAFVAQLRGALHRLLSPLFFRSVGRNVRIYAGVRRATLSTNVSLEDGAVVGHSVFFQTARASSIQIGRNSSLNTGCHIVAMRSIEIGENVSIGEYVSIRDQEHRFSINHGVHGQGYTIAPIKIDSNVWIGRGVYIGPGTSIGSGSIIGANSVLKGGIFPPNVLIAGVPAGIKRQITPDSNPSARQQAGLETTS